MRNVAVTSDTARFVGDIPIFYDRGLGPVIFEDCADDIAQRAAASARAASYCGMVISSSTWPSGLLK
jgi:hypothetical protein